MEIITGIFIVVCLYYFIKLYAVKWILNPIGFVLLLPIAIPIAGVMAIRKGVNAWAWYIFLGCYVCIVGLISVAVFVKS